MTNWKQALSWHIDVPSTFPPDSRFDTWIETDDTHRIEYSLLYRDTTFTDDVSTLLTPDGSKCGRVLFQTDVAGDNWNGRAKVKSELGNWFDYVLVFDPDNLDYKQIKAKQVMDAYAQLQEHLSWHIQPTDLYKEFVSTCTTLVSDCLNQVRNTYEPDVASISSIYKTEDLKYGDSTLDVFVSVDNMMTDYTEKSVKLTVEIYLKNPTKTVLDALKYHMSKRFESTFFIGDSLSLGAYNLTLPMLADTRRVEYTVRRLVELDEIINIIGAVEDNSLRPVSWYVVDDSYDERIVDKVGNVRYYKDKKLHRLDGPAIERVDGDKMWYQDNKLHRTDGPAIEYADGTKDWYQNGNRHRTDGPAVEWTDGYKMWYINDKLIGKSINGFTNEDFERYKQEHNITASKLSWHIIDDSYDKRRVDEDGNVYYYKDKKLHRTDGPAIEWADGAKEWYQDDKRHRTDGPAVERANGDRVWWINDKLVGRSSDGFTAEDFERYKQEHNITASKLGWQVNPMLQSSVANTLPLRNIQEALATYVRDIEGDDSYDIQDVDWTKFLKYLDKTWSGYKMSYKKELIKMPVDEKIENLVSDTLGYHGSAFFHTDNTDFYSAADMMEIHDKEMKKRHLDVTNAGWGATDESIASKTRQGVFVTYFDLETGQVEHSLQAR